jgi:hypothetical protein
MLFSRKRIRWYAREWIAAASCLTALGVTVAVFFSQSRPRRYRLSISGGNARGLRHQNEALARFADGKLEGGQLLAGFVSHINDARNYLNRLILHERDNLEDRAVTERRTAESVWNEALAGSNAGIPVPEDAVERPVLIESRVETSSH